MLHSICPADLSASYHTAPLEPVHTPGKSEVLLFPEHTPEPPSSSSLFPLLGSLISYLCPSFKPVLTPSWSLFWTPQPEVLPNAHEFPPAQGLCYSTAVIFSLHLTAVLSFSLQVWSSLKVTYASIIRVFTTSSSPVKYVEVTKKWRCGWSEP